MFKLKKLEIGTRHLLIAIFYISCQGLFPNGRTFDKRLNFSNLARGIRSSRIFPFCFLE